jgi:hypothetical protein
MRPVGTSSVATATNIEVRCITTNSNRLYVGFGCGLSCFAVFAKQHQGDLLKGSTLEAVAASGGRDQHSLPLHTTY